MWQKFWKIKNYQLDATKHQQNFWYEGPLLMRWAFSILHEWPKVRYVAKVSDLVIIIYRAFRTDALLWLAEKKIIPLRFATTENRYKLPQRAACTPMIRIWKKKFASEKVILKWPFLYSKHFKQVFALNARRRKFHVHLILNNINIKWRRVKSRMYVSSGKSF